MTASDCRGVFGMVALCLSVFEKGKGGNTLANLQSGLNLRLPVFVMQCDKSRRVI